MTRYTGRVTPEDRLDSPYHYVPFDVPPGAPGVGVRLTYDRSRAVIDLGIFDEKRFRGYSGSARDRFVITRSHATPGYVRGEIPSGTWRLLLGLHRLPDDGVGYEVDIEIATVRPERVAPSGPLAPRPEARRLPASPGRRWLAGDLHSHSVHSDGAHTSEWLANAARSRGLDFLAITDHNTMSHHDDLSEWARRSDVCLIPGQEVTTGKGHANCFGDVGWVDFRRGPDEWLRHAESRGGLMSVNHPVQPDCAWLWELQRAPHLVEVWHGGWDWRSHTPIGWWRSFGGVPVGGSDLHRPGDGRTLGSPTTWVEAEDGDVLGAMAEGRVALSRGPREAVILQTDDELVVLGGAGGTLQRGAGASLRVRDDELRLAAVPGPHLLVDDGGELLALTP